MAWSSTAAVEDRSPLVLESRKFPHITRVYGAVHGVRGIVGEHLLDLTRETTHNLEQVARAKEIIASVGRPIVTGAEAIEYLDIPFAATRP